MFHDIAWFHSLPVYSSKDVSIATSSDYTSEILPNYTSGFSPVNKDFPFADFLADLFSVWERVLLRCLSLAGISGFGRLGVCHAGGCAGRADV